MLIVETWRPLVQWSPKDDAHTWLRSDDRRAMRPTGRVKYSYNGVQEIVGGTHSRRWGNEDISISR